MFKIENEMFVFTTVSFLRVFEFSRFNTCAD